MRRFATVAMSLLALGMLVARAEAAELKGFGPIKFGMTKDEAWAAIEGRGEWLLSGVLKYPQPYNLGQGLGHDKGTLEVLQSFKNGLADDMVTEYSNSQQIDDCFRSNAQFVSEIKRKYQVEPLVSQGLFRQPNEDEGDFPYIIEDLYVFMFEANAAIILRNSYRFEALGCRIAITYRAPSDDDGHSDK